MKTKKATKKIAKKATKKAEAPERDWIAEVGAPAYAAIAEMVAALQCDRERLEELREDRDSFIADQAANEEDRYSQWAQASPDEADELRELEEAAGDCKDEEEARERIEEDPLSLRIFGEKINGEWEADRYELLLCTGGPAVRIVGDLDGDEPTSARLEVQDWWNPWSEYIPADHDVLMAYVGCFYFGS